MGYQDGYGLRSGRSRDKVSADRGSSSSAFGGAAGYRAAGSITPPRKSEDKVKSVTGAAALSQFGSTQVPSSPGLMQTIATSAASKAAGNALERGADKLLDRGVGALFNGGNDLRLADTAKDAGGYINLTTGAETFPVVDSGAGIEYLGDSAGSAAGLADSGFIDTMGDWGGAADAASAGADFVPGAGSLIRLAQGDIEGAAGSAAGAMIGNAILPGIGGVIGGAIGGGCFITEATMAGLGVQDDDAEPLKVLRFFRDKVLAGTPQGQAMIEEYESIAPLVVEAVESRPDAMEIFKSIYEQFIAPAVEAVKAGDYPKALQIYAAMIAAVTPYAQEAMDAQDELDGMGMEGDMQGGEMEAMQDMGEHAEMVAEDPQMAEQAVQGGAQQGMMQGRGALSQITADEDYPSSVRFGRK